MKIRVDKIVNVNLLVVFSGNSRPEAMEEEDDWTHSTI